MAKIQHRGTPKWVARVLIFGMGGSFGQKHHMSKFGQNRSTGRPILKNSVKTQRDRKLFGIPPGTP